MAKMVFDSCKLRRGGVKTMNALRKIDGDIRTYVLSDTIKGIAQQAQIKAQETLYEYNAPKSTSQQLSPKEAAYEVGVRYDEVANTAYVFAPVNEENKNAMYFLEYGAGLHSSGKSYTNGKAWIYPIKNGETDEHREVSAGLAVQYKNGTAKYPLREQAIKFKGYGDLRHLWFGVTKTSKPVKYMQAARHFIEWEARPKVIKALRLYLQSPTRRTTEYVYK